MFKLPRRAVAGSLVALLAFAGAACGDDEEPAETGDAPEEETTTSAPADEETTTTESADPGDEGDDPAGEVVEIIGTNEGTTSYSFEDVPADPIPAGSQLSLTNTGTEPHELVALLIPEDETRTIDEIAQLSPEEQEEIFPSDVEPATVILAATGTTDTPGAVVGDGTISEPGRYAIICSLPVGSTDEILSGDGPPVSDAPPHVALGMYAELIVE